SLPLTVLTLLSRPFFLNCTYLIYLLLFFPTRRSSDLFQTAIKDLLGILGIQLEEEALLDQEIDQLILEREEARKEKDFTKADEIRDLLKSKDIILEDTVQGVRWRRKV